MTRAKIAVIVGTIALAIVLVVGLVLFLRRQSEVGSRTTEQNASVASGDLRSVAEAETPKNKPSFIPETLPPSVAELEGSYVFAAETDSVAKSLAEVLYPAAPASGSPDQGTFVIPTSKAGTGAGSASVSGIQGSADTDRDGLTSDQEYQQGTDPNRADTDGDGLLDGDEVRTHRTDPNVMDTDGDDLTDGDEVNTWRTDPLNPDTDTDGFMDGTEVKGGYNPRGPGKR